MPLADITRAQFESNTRLAPTARRYKARGAWNAYPERTSEAVSESPPCWSGSVKKGVGGARKRAQNAERVQGAKQSVPCTKTERILQASNEAWGRHALHAGAGAQGAKARAL